MSISSNLAWWKGWCPDCRWPFHAQLLKPQYLFYWRWQWLQGQWLNLQCRLQKISGACCWPKSREVSAGSETQFAGLCLCLCICCRLFCCLCQCLCFCLFLVIDTSLPRWPLQVDPLHEVPVEKAAAGGAEDLADKVSHFFWENYFLWKLKQCF